MAYNPPIGSIYHLYTTYILLSGGLYNPYHLLGEPETTVEILKKHLRLQCVEKFPTNKMEPPQDRPLAMMAWDIGKDGHLGMIFWDHGGHCIGG